MRRGRLILTLWKGSSPATLALARRIGPKLICALTLPRRVNSQKYVTPAIRRSRDSSGALGRHRIPVSTPELRANAGRIH